MVREYVASLLQMENLCIVLWLKIRSSQSEKEFYFKGLTTQVEGMDRRLYSTYNELRS